MNVGGELGRKGWMKFKVDWEESIPYNGKYTNKARRLSHFSKRQKTSRKEKDKKKFLCLF